MKSYHLGPRAVRKLRPLEAVAVPELEAMYDAFRRRHAAQRKACGLVAKEDAAWDAEKVAMRALQALLQTAPTTPQGRAALAKHLADTFAEHPSNAPAWALQAALQRLAKS